MKQLIIIETAHELLKFARRERCEGDDSPIIPHGATLVFDNKMDHVHLEAEGFTMDDSITMEEVLKALGALAGFKVHIT